MKLIVKNSHFKILYEKNEEYIREILKERFSFKDNSLEKTWEVKKGIKSAYVSFYIDEYDLLPTGFLTFCKVFLKKENIQFEIIDQRKFPKYDSEFLNSPMQTKGTDGVIYTPRYYQVEALKEVIKRGGGCIQIATGMGKCLQGDYEIEIEVEEDFFNFLKQNDYLSNKNSLVIKIKPKRLFKALEEYENKKFVIDNPCLFKTNIKIKNENSIFKDIVAFIIKEDDIYEIEFTNNYKIKVGKSHVIILDKDKSIEKFVKGLKIGDKLKLSNGEFLEIKNINLLNKEFVYDFQIDSENPWYQTPDKIIHHNSFIHALICRAYPKAKILNLFDRVSLINQTEKAFIEKYGFSKKDVGVIQGQRVEDDKRIILLSLMSYENAFSVFPSVDIIIGDEAHSTMRNDTAEKIINSCQNASIKIGVSATIDKIANPYEQAKLYSLAGPIIYNKEIKEGIDENSLSDGDVIFIKYNSEPKEIKGTYQDIYKTEKIKPFNYKSIIFENNQLKVKNKIVLSKIQKDDLSKIEQVKMLGNKNKEIEIYNDILNSSFEDSLKKDGWELINKDGERYKRKFVDFGDESLIYIENESRNNIIKAIAEKEANKGRRTVILFSRIKHGEKLHSMIPGSFLISGIDSEEKKNEVEEYIKKNKNAIVIVSTIWQTGKDIPELESFINATGGKSAIALIQKIGRLTRKSEKTGKKQFYFYDFIDDHINPIAKKQTIERIKTVENLKLKISRMNYEH